MNTKWYPAAILVVVFTMAYGGRRALVETVEARPATSAELQAATGGSCYECDSNPVTCTDVDCTQGGGGGSWYIDGSDRTEEPYCKTVSTGVEDCLDGTPMPCTTLYECADLGCQQGCEEVNVVKVDSACYGAHACGG